MSPDTGMTLVLFAGGMTFANEWLQTREINWRVPVATVLAGAATAGVGRVSPGGAASLGVMAIIVAATTPLNGRSPVQEISAVVNNHSARKHISRTVRSSQ